MLYSGGFFGAGDKNLMRQVPGLAPEELARRRWDFRDARLPLMLFRYRARNFPETLSAREREDWDVDRARRLITPRDEKQFSLDQFKAVLAEYRRTGVGDVRAHGILDQLESWVLDTGLERLWREHGSGHQV